MHSIVSNKAYQIPISYNEYAETWRNQEYRFLREQIKYNRDFLYDIKQNLGHFSTYFPVLVEWIRLYLQPIMEIDFILDIIVEPSTFQNFSE